MEFAYACQPKRYGKINCTYNGKPISDLEPPINLKTELEKGRCKWKRENYIDIKPSSQAKASESEPHFLTYIALCDYGPSFRSLLFFSPVILK